MTTRGPVGFSERSDLPGLFCVSGEFVEQTVTAPAAPAQPAESQTQSATHAAVAAGSTSEYRAARRAERQGTPLPAVPVAAPADTDTAEPISTTEPATERQVSKRQQQINDYERRLAEQQERIRALEQRATPSAPEPAAPALPEKKDPEWKRYRAMPDAPKLEDFDTIEDHTAAMALFIADTRATERTQESQDREHKQQRDRFLQERATNFGEKLRAARTADPEFLTKLPQELVQAKPLTGLQRGEPVTFANFAAEVGFRSDDPAAFFTYLGTHHDEAARISRLPVDEWMPSLTRLDGRLSAPKPAAPPPPAPKTLSDAPDARTLGSRPAQAADPMAGAVRRGDTRAYRQLRREQRAASMGRR